jgi:hypothetical protein
MTYGENGGQIRSELTTLLRQHRIQHRLGGKGLHTLPETTTPEQREQLGQLIQRYRNATLGWCLHAVVAANPRINLERTTQPSRGSREELLHRITRSIKASHAGLPTLNELTTSQEFAIVESWRQVAKAAVLGEHDLAGLMDNGRMSTAQCMTVLTDAAEVTRALVVLDKRYDNIPGWISLRERGRLDHAAQVCSVFVSHEKADYTVDHKGWRPQPATIDGGPLPGIGGVLQAEHNMLVHLARTPNALNLRRVLDGQRILSHEAAIRATKVAPDLNEKWLKRERTYQELVHETRNVGGLIGLGGHSAAEAAFAVGRLRGVHVAGITSAEPLRELDKLFTRTDACIATIIERGVAERLYLVSARVPRVVESTNRLVSPVRKRYMPIKSSIRTDLLAISRYQLRPPSVAPVAPPAAHEGRKELRESIGHRAEKGLGPTR